MTRSYFNGKAEIWDGKIAEKNSSKLESMAGRLDIKPGGAVLDVGTGTGVFIPFLLKKVGGKGRLVCLDSAEKMLEKARAKNFSGNIEYVTADISSTTFDDEVFDAAICYSSFPHFRDKTKALAEINRVLKKGGKLFICHTSSRTKINQRHRQTPELIDDIIPDENEMHELLSQAGYEQIRIEDRTDSYLANAKKREF